MMMEGVLCGVLVGGGQSGRCELGVGWCEMWLLLAWAVAKAALSGQTKPCKQSSTCIALGEMVETGRVSVCRAWICLLCGRYFHHYRRPPALVLPLHMCSFLPCSARPSTSDNPLHPALSTGASPSSSGWLRWRLSCAEHDAWLRFSFLAWPTQRGGGQMRSCCSC